MSEIGVGGSGSSLLTLNAGSSSIKFSLFERVNDGTVDGLRELLRGQAEGFGATPRLVAKRADGTPIESGDGANGMTDHASALDAILGVIELAGGGGAISAVGHRVVHGGMDHAAPVEIDDVVLASLEDLVALAPLHQPHNLSGVKAARTCFPVAVQVACFDTAFHRHHPWVNDTFALPRELYDAGIRRYGFHGLSYEYVTEEMTRIAPYHAAGRMVVAHLGNGASLCAIRDGRSIGSTMGFTALDGLPMGTRCGQLDPGVVLHLLEHRGMSPAEVTDLLYRRSGLKGLSGISHDMRELEASDDPAAARAVDYFTTRIRREIGAMAALIGGLDALVFCGGIGEHSTRVREAVAGSFDWLGVELDRERNARGEQIVSTDRSRVRVFVVPTDEETMIARHTARTIGESG